MSLSPFCQILNHSTAFHKHKRLEDVTTQYVSYIPQQQHGWRANLQHGTPKMPYTFAFPNSVLYSSSGEGSNLYALNGTFRHGQ